MVTTAEGYAQWWECGACRVMVHVCQVRCAHPRRKSNGISVCTRVAPLAAKYQNMSGTTASASNDSERKTQDLEDGLAQLTMRPQPDVRTRALTAPALDQYLIPAPGYPTPPGVGAGAFPTPLPRPYSPSLPVYPSYPAVGFNTSASDLPPPYPMYPPPSNQTGYSQGYPPQVAYPTAPPPHGPFPVSSMSHSTCGSQGTPVGMCQLSPCTHQLGMKGVSNWVAFVE